MAGISDGLLDAVDEEVRRITDECYAEARRLLRENRAKLDAIVTQLLAHVWSRSYDREQTSLLGLQQELSTSIAEQIRLQLSPDNLRGVRQRQTQNADAYDAYLRARYFESRRTPATNARAIQQYERAIALDSSYALAWAGLAFTYASSALNGDARPLEVWPRARDAAARAVRANANLGEAQLAVGYVNWLLDWDWKAAETAVRLAIRLDPSNAAAHRSLGHVLSQTGQHTEAESAMRRTRELEPLEPLTYALSAQVAFQARQYSAAVEHESGLRDPHRNRRWARRWNRDANADSEDIGESRIALVTVDENGPPRMFDGGGVLPSLERNLCRQCVGEWLQWFELARAAHG